ncbi:hypothetical protein L7F22_031494 [Adiantum nelumboides]|nr:hypothetical protein [Adiantum nelumboides]
MGGSGYPGAQGAAASRPQGALLAGSGSAGGLGAATNAAGGGNASAVASMAVAETMNSMLQSLPHYLVFSPQAAIFASNNALKRLVCGAIERAIREIIAPVVERSVTIASVSARELITKDFSMESDENKMRKAAHQMLRA